MNKVPNEAGHLLRLHLLRHAAAWNLMEAFEAGVLPKHMSSPEVKEQN